MLRGRFTKCVRQLKALYWPEIQLQLDSFLFPKYCALKAQLLQTHMKYKAEKKYPGPLLYVAKSKLRLFSKSQQ